MQRPPARPFRLMTGGAPGAQPRGWQQTAGLNRYKPLYQVAIRDGYYTGEDGRCPDFEVRPSPDSADLMRGQGLVFKDEGTGFSVYVDEQRIPGLIEFLCRQAGADGQCWTRLSFVLIPRNPLLVGLTALPIDTNPTLVNLYAANSGAHWQGRRLMLAPGRAIGAAALRPVTPAQFALPVPSDVTAVVITDIGGTPVEILTVKPQTPPPSYIQIDLSTLPLGLYGFHVEGPTAVPDQTLLYTAARPPPLCFLDLMFTRPRPDMGGVYPVPPLFDDLPVDPAAVGDLRYDLQFEARPTWWHYYVVSQTPGSVLTDLPIDGPGATFRRRPGPVPLPNGERATLFEAEATLPLRQLSPQRFRLRGRRRDAFGGDNEIRVECLPVAPDAPVWPGPTTETGISEMFVYV